jgi:hypothetical protein
MICVQACILSQNIFFLHIYTSLTATLVYSDDVIAEFDYIVHHIIEVIKYALHISYIHFLWGE